MDSTHARYWQERTWVVTGAAGGQGAAETLKLLDRGSSVIAVDIAPGNDEVWSALRRAADELSGQLVSVSGDVSDPALWARVSELVTMSDRLLGGMVNNAAITSRLPLSATNTETWERVLRINLTGPFLGMRDLGPRIAEGGSIVNISSVAGTTGSFATAYSTSKWGLRGLSRSAAIEFARRSIRVNVVAPGLVDTPMVSAAQRGPNSQQFYDASRELTPLGRAASSDEIAEVVVFLLGPDSSFITGADIVVDGGLQDGGLFTHIANRINSQSIDN